ncbi:MAG TPA: Rieske 2Fe-2S domain-containing protein [Burkholderiaceae bacterium]|nr:Rieske 2Fe-2S domain-containing protein [Burkholderiaceae bacterium]HQR74785.1 Rieske 2Fe-2S domain-containing protein [Burkholderiaceae bacterium]
MAAGFELVPICSSDTLVDGSRGVRFDVKFMSEPVPAFAVRHKGAVVAYLNRCAHVAMELDWQPGEFFEPDAEYLMCATHGALYDPATGACRGGACMGHGGLRALTVVEREGMVFWVPDSQARPR